MNDQMTLDQFAKITRRVIAQDGFSDFQPTACYPSRREIKALAGLPSDIDPEGPVLDWAARSVVSGEEFLVAFKITEDSFRIIRREDLVTERHDYAASSP